MPIRGKRSGGKSNLGVGSLEFGGVCGGRRFRAECVRRNISHHDKMRAEGKRTDGL